MTNVKKGPLYGPFLLIKEIRVSEFEIQAHRGARAFYPENTLQAFCKAAELGVRVLELDLLLSKDAKIVVSHDPWVNASHFSGEPAARYAEDVESRSLLFQMNYDLIAAVDCGYTDPAFPLQERITACKPLLSDVFSAVDAFMREHCPQEEMVYNLEVKSWPDQDDILHPLPALYAEILLHDLSPSVVSRIRLQSFDSRILKAAHRMSPELCYGLLVERAEDVESSLETLGFVPAFVNPHYSQVSVPLLSFLHLRNIRVIPWTVNRPEEMLAMKRMGADGLITDYPDLALSLSPLFS